MENQAPTEEGNLQKQLRQTRRQVQIAAVCSIVSLLIVVGMLWVSARLRHDIVRHAEMSAELTQDEERATALETKIKGLEARAAALEKTREAAVAAATAGSLASHTDAAGPDEDDDGVHGDQGGVAGGADKCPKTGTGTANAKGCELLQVIGGTCKAPMWLEGNAWLFFEGCEFADADQANGVICTWNATANNGQGEKGKYENCQARPPMSVP